MSLVRITPLYTEKEELLTVLLVRVTHPTQVLTSMGYPINVSHPEKETSVTIREGDGSMVRLERNDRRREFESQ